MKTSRKAAETIKVVVIVLCCILFLLPVYFLIMNSFKSLNEIMISFISFPKQFTLRNYVGAMEKINYLRTFGNTLFLTVGSVILTLIVCSLAGYKIQRTKSKLSKISKSYLAIGQMVPFSVIMVPLSQILGKLGINNNLPGLLFVYCAMYIPMMTFVYSGYCDSISEQLDEAATIDGCNQFQVFFQADPCDHGRAGRGVDVERPACCADRDRPDAADDADPPHSELHRLPERNRVGFLYGIRHAGNGPDHCSVWIPAAICPVRHYRRRGQGLRGGALWSLCNTAWSAAAPTAISETPTARR